MDPENEGCGTLDKLEEDPKRKEQFRQTRSGALQLPPTGRMAPGVLIADPSGLD